MKKFYLQVFFLSWTFIFISCKNFVTNVDPPIDQIKDSELNNESQLPFLINGVEIQSAAAYSETDILAADLSDAFIFNPNVPNETDPQFDEINNGNIREDNTHVTSDYRAIGQLRYYADDLVRRTNSIVVHDTTLRNRALFTGYFYGGLARYLYAAFFGISETEGGSPINNGPFISSNSLYDYAIVKFEKSLQYTDNSLTIRNVNSMIAKSYLYKGGSGDYDSAAIFADQGLVSGDADFNTISGKNFWQNASKENLLEMVADYRFKKYIDVDPNESARIKLDTVQVIKDSTAIEDSAGIKDTTVIRDTTIYYSQSAYPGSSSPTKIISWQENNLMRAELALRGFGSNPEQLVNEVRESHNIEDLNSPVNLDIIYTERDKELFPSGNRLVDERRFNKWHLGPGTWEYLPIPQSERDGNHNIN